MKLQIAEKLKAVFRSPCLSAEKKRELLRASLVMLAVCASAALLLSGLNELVSGVIEYNLKSPVRQASERILPAEEYAEIDFEFEEAHGIVAIYEAKSGEELLGYCVEVNAQDYNGEMTAAVAVDVEGNVAAVEIISMPEGVGTKVKDSKFLSQFASKRGKLTAVLSSPKDDTQISAVSGATASSNAVTECVNHAVEAVSQITAEKAKEAVQ